MCGGGSLSVHVSALIFTVCVFSDYFSAVELCVMMYVVNSECLKEQ